MPDLGCEQHVDEASDPERRSRHPRTRSATSELLAEIVPNVEYFRLDGLAHMAPVTHADDVNPLIIEHIFANATDESIAVA